MADEQFSQFTNGNTPAAGDFVAGYAVASAGVVGGNRRWSFTNIATRISAILGLGTIVTQDADDVAITGGTIDGTDIGDSTPAVGNFTNVNISGLTGSRVVITDALKTLASLAYDTANTSSALVQRDSSGNIAVTGVNATGNVTSGTANKTLVLKQGANGKTGTVTLNGVTPVTITNSSITANSGIIFTLKTVGGTVGAYPVIQTITPTTGCTVAGTTLDTSTYNYHIIESAA